ncbi:hypothetical protein TWF569_002847 [Orbilia oligospora]|uniref:Uncharacterized protein n=1 Tax=Orbilia oligospora TaxID=2813651 RepID=A0A7C8JDK8_ORBOL|nr:hypothetical protein TWF103_001332 [Orbilia oligospora]KAF3095295.1 hypothetical protein TWF102_007344 [Orbilia oligospora]KAF3116388.1 hypothetical protein TWF706_004029 [Orbilia oligospora]KAF3120992.1 hypothetical protein TWF569_002847 [Orbilia oligospora]KAF3121331.1 hypothetical protein TWF594_003229 [Orbilia oligospora]
MSEQDTRKTVLITGAGVGGIGGSLAEEFNRKGYRVFATARRTETLEPLSKLGIELLSLDVTKPESIASCKSQVESLTNGKLDILINNAGRNYTMPALDLSIHEVRDMFETNVFGVMAVTQSFAPLIINAQGKIVMIGSLAAVMPYAFGASYGASKAAIHAYCNTLRVEMKAFGVEVINVVTGGVRTQLARVERELPADSYYSPIRDFFAKRVQYSQKNSIPPEVYAKNVVAQLTRRHSSSWIWEGYFAWRAWALDTFFPRWIFVS